MKELEYPFDAEFIIEKKKKLRRLLLEREGVTYIEKKIAVLGGQTTQNITLVLELFLLNYGIKPTFYESEYNMWFQDGMFDNEELKAFAPDVIYICTCNRNIERFPAINDPAEAVEKLKQDVFDKFKAVWQHIADTYHCAVIQNNFEYPSYRLLGNADASDIHGKVNFISRLNADFAEYAGSHDNFFLLDVNYISSVYGLDKWSQPFYWHMYKYAVSVPAIPFLSFNVANIIKSLYGRNKKAFNLDLDNTLWGGVIGDDGADNIEIGQETPMAQGYSEFQEYLKLHKEMGVLLTVNSKNDEANALSGFERPDSILKREDFASFKANWEPKSENLRATATELNLLPESFVFVDDNPAERAIISAQHPGCAVPEIGEVEEYIKNIDRSGFFEVTSLSADDLKRAEMYRQNAERSDAEASFADYGEYLKFLEMKGEIGPFKPLYMARIAQLTNKSNQFNLTTRRYSQAEIEGIAADSSYITLYGKLIDKFGDNGVVSVIIGKKNANTLDIDLWLMSCRVLKRDMEFAMMDELVHTCQTAGITMIRGHYYPTAKNGMVRDFYDRMGFTKTSEDPDGNTDWEFTVTSDYIDKQYVIAVNR